MEILSYKKEGEHVQESNHRLKGQFQRATAQVVRGEFVGSI